MANAILTYADAELTRAQAAVTAATAALSAATVTLNTPSTGARAYYEDCVQKLAESRKTIASKRAKLATVTVPAEAEALLVEITDEIETERGLARDVVEARAALDKAKLALAQCEAELEAAKSALKAAETLKEAAGKDDKTWTAWSTALADTTTSPKLGQLKADATAALLADPYTSVKADFETLPLKFRDLVTSRWKVLAGRQTLVRDTASDMAALLAAAEESTQGKDGALAKARNDLDLAVADLQDYVQRGRERYDAAIACLTALKTSKLLSSVESSELPSGDHLTTAVGNAADHAKAFNEAQVDVDEAQAAFDVKLAELAATDPDDDGTASAEYATLTTAIGTRNTVGALSSAEEDALSAWLVIVTDESWGRLAGYLGAVDTLTELSGLNPTSLTTPLSTAQTAVATALEAAGEAQRQRQYLERATLRSDGARKAFDAALVESVLSALGSGVE